MRGEVKMEEKMPDVDSWLPHTHTHTERYHAPNSTETENEPNF